MWQLKQLCRTGHTWYQAEGGPLMNYFKCIIAQNDKKSGKPT